MDNLQLIATAPMGLEAVVARELMDLGYKDQKVENGRVIFRGGLKDICRANLWLRTSDRVLIKMAEFPARTFEELFEGTKAVNWPDWIPEDAEFPVEGRSHKSQLTSVPACQSIVKKAVVEKMKSSYGTEWFHEDNGQRFVIEVWLLNDNAMLTLDTTGPGLHKRGYRKLVTEAPLKETMAAAMVLLSRWRPERPLYDPFCGSGTIPIEAAMIGWNIAPGLRRTFNSESWPIISEELWEQAREEAFDSVKDDIPLQITGSDIDPQALEIAAAAVKKAGFAREIKLQQVAVSRVKPEGDYGCIITNPPYGARLGDEDDAEKAIRQLGLSALYLPTWSLFALTQSRTFEETIGRKADKKRKLFNGRIECAYYQFFGPLPPRNKPENPARP
ncbi:THUMP domain-containing class I SAM-dependent RNA methyltransferase [Paenibacillus montanisoli]|uniref:Class I SAM-dependent RNA methyltransferase n=1 Tax=Paenibacillus montanisoli TaxID=2081970 RepID=A0A328U6U7_9BACL|nr:class I SAM-dependent RNA methyltransferase [Paenibacillus montanisoli]RAP77822.1 class I SAM-dependent RNA methyltransferase [Paenibacillus montanisoli]